MDTQKAKRVLRSIRKIRHEKFVLHGSLVKSNTLLPRRPKLKGFKSKRKTRGIKERGVYATRLVEVAVLYASLPYDLQWQPIRRERYIRVGFVGKEIQVREGYIHVCRATSFDGRGLITRSKKAVKVVRTFRLPIDAFLYLWDRQDIRLYDRLIRPRLTLPRRSSV